MSEGVKILMSSLDKVVKRSHTVAKDYIVASKSQTKVKLTAAEFSRWYLVRGTRPVDPARSKCPFPECRHEFIGEPATNMDDVAINLQQVQEHKAVKVAFQACNDRGGLSCTWAAPTPDVFPHPKQRSSTSSVIAIKWYADETDRREILAVGNASTRTGRGMHAPTPVDACVRSACGIVLRHSRYVI